MGQAMPIQVPQYLEESFFQKRALEGQGCIASSCIEQNPINPYTLKASS